ncbi:dienelactone hydrolase family protein [Aspergillus undulatus]|uniref:dienelactone hydrolase family protein n=1 Tax=Aspergillus undulatus TaxID=1810928 RepID=UPI003CCD3156
MTCEACRTIPPVIAEGYTPKGTSSVIGELGFKTYITGPPTSKTAILTIYDIFGNSPQTTQGADILAARLNALVIIPDFFDGPGAKHEWVPADTTEKAKLLMAFVNTKASWVDAARQIPNLVDVYKGCFPNVERWGAYGLCWGGKVLALSSGQGTRLAASVQVHPGRMDGADAQNIAIPHAILASKDEPVAEVEKYAEFIKEKGLGGFVETYEGMWHGWMGARANLEKEESLKEYVRG